VGHWDGTDQSLTRITASPLLVGSETTFHKVHPLAVCRDCQRMAIDNFHAPYDGVLTIKLCVSILLHNLQIVNPYSIKFSLPSLHH